jgi:hypothetical protein
MSYIDMVYLGLLLVAFLGFGAALGYWDFDRGTQWGKHTASRRATYPFDDTPCPISAGLTEEQAQ